MIISKKNFEEAILKSFEAGKEVGQKVGRDEGIALGYILGYRNRQSELTNLGFMVGSQIDEIMKKKECE